MNPRRAPLVLALLLVPWVGPPLPATLGAQGRESIRDVPASIKVIASYDMSSFPNFERVVSSLPGITSATADTRTGGYGLTADYRLSGRPFFAQAGFSKGSHDFEQRFQRTDPQLPSSVIGKVDALFADLAVGWMDDFDFFELWALFGTSYARNESTYDNDFGIDLGGCLECPASGNRVHTAWKPRIGLGVDLRVLRNARVRVGFDHIGSFDRNDADDAYRARIGFGYVFRGGF